MKRATPHNKAKNKHYNISIHALVKRATYANFVEFVEIFYFNPRPREEGDLRLVSLRHPQKYFNPRPREEGDAMRHFEAYRKGISIHALVKRATSINVSVNFEVIYISIHALVKRATITNGMVGVMSAISIHALVKRATKAYLTRINDKYHFNPRPREEGDGR